MMKCHPKVQNFILLASAMINIMIIQCMINTLLEIGEYTGGIGEL